MMQRLILTSSTVFGTLIAVNSAYGQVIPDATTDTSIIDNCQTSCALTGGTVAGENLFHSFQKFNIAPEARVNFDDPGVANIFSRVTGSNPSEIFGTLGVRGGDANLFLLNPNGIIFGEGATLDLNGSFFATTADEIQFGDRSFSAIPNETELSLLTINPSVLLFDRITQAGAITLENTEIKTAAGQNIALLGRGNTGVELNNSTIDVTEGNISLGGVNDRAEIALQEDWQLEFPSSIALGDITITAGSKIAANNQSSLANTAIWIDTDNLSLNEGSKIFTSTTGIEKGINGANIAIDARTSITLTGEDSTAFQTFIAGNLVSGGNASLSDGLETTTFGAGNAGDITIATPNLTVDRGTGIVSATRNTGNSGRIDLNIADNIYLRESGLLTGSGFSSSGNVGEINLKTQELIVEQNSAISSSTLGEGNAGNLRIDASESIEIKNTSADAIVPTGIFTNTIYEDGNGGNLQINTPQLILQNGGQLSASSGAVFVTGNDLKFIRSGGKGGNINLKIGESLKVKGTSADGRFSSSILSDTRSSSNAGNVTIETSDLYLGSDGLISTSSLDEGEGGNIAIDASNSVEVNGAGIENLQALIIDGLKGKLNPTNIKGGIAAYSIGNGEAGSITIDTDSLDLNLGAVISTATYGDKNAGDLAIDASEIKVTGSAIIAPTFGAGDGGDINLKTRNINITKGGAIASASLNRGAAGDINILATESIAIFDIIPNLLFSGSISTGSYSGLGVSGNLTLDTKRLLVRDGANIETNNAFYDLSGTGIIPKSISLGIIDPRTQGKLMINATESIEISGTASEANKLNQSPNSHIYSTTNIQNPASNIEINTSKLSIFDGGEISVSSLNSGAAGTLAINADSATLRNEGKINGTTVSGRGGNIDLQIAGILAIDAGSVIKTDASQGNGGNIDIAADFVVAKSASISAGALKDGTGGNINIVANDIFLTADSSINADSALGIDGTVKVKTLFNTERNNLARLPQQIIRADNKIVRSCSNSDRQGVFSYTGRGGLPFNPLTDFQTDDIVIADLDIPVQKPERQIQPEASSKLDLLQTKAIEATQWKVNDSGKVELTATSHSSTILDFAVYRCPLFNKNS